MAAATTRRSRRSNKYSRASDHPDIHDSMPALNLQKTFHWTTLGVWFGYAVSELMETRSEFGSVKFYGLRLRDSLQLLWWNDTRFTLSLQTENANKCITFLELAKLQAQTTPRPHG